MIEVNAERDRKQNIREERTTLNKQRKLEDTARELHSILDSRCIYCYIMVAAKRDEGS